VIEQGTAAAIALFVVPVIFYLGALAQRVTHVEAWRDEQRRELDAIHTALREIQSDLAHRKDP